MNTFSSRSTVWVYVVGVLGTFLIMAAMVGLMRRYIRPAPVNATRIAERRKAAADASLANQQLETYAVIDAAKGLYQLRIDQAMEMVIRCYRVASPVNKARKPARQSRAHRIVLLIFIVVATKEPTHEED